MTLHTLYGPIDDQFLVKANTNFSTIYQGQRTLNNTVQGMRNVIDSIVTGGGGGSSGGGGSNLEVLQARGGFNTLHSRLIAMEESVARKRDQEIDISMNDLSPDLIGAITGSGTVSIESIPRDGSVTEKKLSANLKKILYGENISITGFKYGTWKRGDGTILTDDVDNRIATKEFTRVSRGDVITISDYDKYKFRAYEFDLVTEQFITTNDIKGENGWATGPYTIQTAECYVRVFLAYADDRKIESKDINLLASKLLPVENESSNGGGPGGDTGNVPSGTRPYVFADSLVGVYSQDNADTHSSFRHNTMTSEVIAEYNKLVTNYPEYASREVIGKNIEGTDTYAYTFRPTPKHYSSHDININLVENEQEHIPKVIITTGVHGDEKGTVFSMMNMFMKLATDWRSDKILEFIRHNVHFVVVPVSNPGGFDVNQRNLPITGVNLNRNFAKGHGDASESGPSPFSTPEAQNIRDLLNRHLDAEFMIDFHNVKRRNYYIGFNMTNDKRLGDAMNQMYNQLGRKWQSEYPYLPQEDDKQFSFSSHHLNGSLAYWASDIGMQGVIVEILSELHNWETGYSRYNDTITTIGTEVIINAVVMMMKNVNELKK